MISGHTTAAPERTGRVVTSAPSRIPGAFPPADRNFAKSRGSSRLAVTYNSQTAREHDRSREPSSTRSLNYAPFG